MVSSLYCLSGAGRPRTSTTKVSRPELNESELSRSSSHQGDMLLSGVQGELTFARYILT